MAEGFISREKALRYLAGFLSPDIRNHLIDPIVKLLPERLRGPWTERIIKEFAEWIEDRPLAGLQEAVADIMRDIGTEIGKQTGRPIEGIEKKIDIKRIEETFAKQLEEGLKKISEAENIEDEKAKQKKIMEAKAEYYKAGLILIREIITSVHQEIEVKEGKKIEWEKVFNRLSEALNRSRTKIGEGTSTAYQKTKEAVKTVDQKAGELADKIEELRKKIRRHGLIPRREKEERQEEELREGPTEF
jgi:hypothetical protein